MKPANQFDAYQILGAIHETTGLRQLIESKKVEGLTREKSREINNNSTPEQCVEWLFSLGVTQEQLDNCKMSYGQICYFA